MTPTLWFLLLLVAVIWLGPKLLRLMEASTIRLTLKEKPRPDVPVITHRRVVSFSEPAARGFRPTKDDDVVARGRR